MKAEIRSLVSPLAVAAVVLINLAGIDAAFAHAVLVDTEPKNRASLAAPPSEIVLIFSETVTPAVVRLLDGNGKAVAEIDHALGKDSRLILPLPPRIPVGQYLVSYRVMSADTHPIAGAFSFNIGSPGEVDGFAVKEERFELARAMVLANRFLQFVSIFIAAGTVFFFVLVRPPEYTEDLLRRIISMASAVAVTTYILAVGVGGVDMAGVGLTSLTDYSIWKLAAGTNLLDSAIAGIAGISILNAAWRIPEGARRSAMLITGGAMALTGLALTGHAGTAAPRWLMTPAVALHLLPAAFWVAATMPLAWITKSSPTDECTLVLNRFSSRAAIALAVLVVSGVCVTIVQVQSFSGLFSTDYGVILTLKFGLVVLLLSLAAINKYRFTPRIEKSEPGSILQLRRLIYLEVVLMVGILILTTLLTTVAPPRSAATMPPRIGNDAPSGEFAATLTQQGYRVDVAISPVPAGRSILTVTVKNQEGIVFSPINVSASMSLPALDIESVKIGLEPKVGGDYQANLHDIAIDGDWELRIDVLVDDFTQLIYRMRVPIGQEEII